MTNPTQTTPVKNPSGPNALTSEPPTTTTTTKPDYTPADSLSQHHLDMLKASAISDEVIRERGYRTITTPAELSDHGFAPAQCRAPGLLLPLHGTDGSKPFFVYRPDSPRVYEDKDHRNPDGSYKQKVIKYEMPKGEKMRLDCPPRCRADLGDPGKTLWITEGQKKADSIASVGGCSVDLLGVWNFKGTNSKGGKVFLPDFDYIALNNGRAVNIVFDSDVMTKPEVRKALDSLIEHMQRKGAIVSAVYLPNGKSGKVGVDDWLAEGHTLEDLENLVESPRPAPKVAPPIVELLDEAPSTIRRPLCLVDGRAYAAIWPYVQKTITQRLDKNGQPITLRQPEIVKEQELHIVRDDGLIYGPASLIPLSSLAMDIVLPEPPTAKDSLWSTKGAKDYEKGIRPDPLNVFSRVKSVINRFIDFGRSLADQDTMAEMLACFALSTWFLDAFPVSPYIWANGERGSGKTSLLLILVRLSYLGVSLSPSGSFAALRDLADYGATLGLDDAEDLTNPAKSDPDKRAILLSGNRKGISVHLKEPGPNGQGWITREVNTFCTRIFSTIAKPDPTLSSRAVIVPVVRTAERSKGNSDPLDNSQWPCDRQKLIDDLWSVSLCHLATMEKFDKAVAEKSKLVGRDLQPWRAILAVAAWLDSLGATGLWAKIESLASGTYQAERLELEKTDLNRLIIRAIGEYAERVPDKTLWNFSTQNIVELVHRMIDDEELEQDKDYVTAKSLGHRLKKMRLEPDKYARPRGWKITRQDLITLLNSYRVTIPEKINHILKDSVLDVNGENGENGENGVVLTVLTVPTVLNKGQEAKISQNYCPACNCSQWWTRQDGVEICATCHPQPR